ncbi:Ig-like domain-containing protein, partial [Neobacillus drentensis]|uniref:Ig-like domain-containing protein n=1 Tax=Neobacillus drentensis TaxID=220684 RepID=UPI002FFF7F92
LGNYGSINPSLALNVFLDNTAPKTPTVNEVTDHSSIVTGTAEVGSTVTVKAGETVLGTSTTTTEGNYSVTIPKQESGTKLSITATDRAENTSEAIVFTVKDVTAPLVPQVNVLTDKDTVVTGTGEANATVYVKVGSTIIGKGKVDTAGKFSVAVPLQKAGTRVSVTVRDSGGNYSPYTTVTVQDKTAPLAPQVNVLTDKDTVVTGTGEANATVYVKVGSTIIGKG